MKTNTFIFIASSLVVLTSCSKSEEVQIDLTPQQTIECEEIGLGTNHPNSTEYQVILDSYVVKGFPGISAVVYTPDEGLWTGTSGLSVIDTKTAVGTCNLFYSGSVAKMYTVTAAMVLYEQGMFDLDDKIENYLSTELVENLPNAKTVTIRQLMNHTSGIPDHDYDDDLNNYLETNNAKLPNPEEILAYLFDDDPLFEPGSRVAYSSANTVVLALVIDAITGGSHEDVITTSIINRVGLTDTYYRNEYAAAIPELLVLGYYGKAGNNKNISKESINYCTSSYGDAGIMATAHDYYLFLRALMQGEIVSEETLQEMLNGVEVVSDNEFSLDFGLGLFNFKLNNKLIKTGHAGFTVGGMSQVWYYPTINSYLVLTTNTSDEDDQNFIREWDKIVSDFENSIESL